MIVMLVITKMKISRKMEMCTNVEGCDHKMTSLILGENYTRCLRCNYTITWENKPMENQVMEEKPVVDETNPKDRLGVLKPQLHLVPPASILYEALAMEDGANKYGPYNWRQKKVRLSIYISACKRHLDEYWDGENEARDSKKPHLAHAKACLGIIIDALETGNLIDDRPTKGSMSDLIERFTKKKTV